MDNIKNFIGGAMDLAKRYLEEKAKWKKAGKPVRSDERIKELFAICSPCEYYKLKTDHSGSCGICGCNIKNRITSLNKLAWATTRCPLENPKWIEEEGYQNLEVSEAEIKKEEQNEIVAEKVTDTKKEQNINPAPIKKKSGGCGCGKKA